MSSVSSWHHRVARFVWRETFRSTSWRVIRYHNGRRSFALQTLKNTLTDAFLSWLSADGLTRRFESLKADSYSRVVSLASPCCTFQDDPSQHETGVCYGWTCMRRKEAQRVPKETKGGVLHPSHQSLLLPDVYTSLTLPGLLTAVRLRLRLEHGMPAPHSVSVVYLTVYTQYRRVNTR